MKKEERGKGCSGPDQQSRNWFLASKAMRKRGTDVGSSVREPSVWGGTHTEMHRCEQRNKKRQRERERERWGGQSLGDQQALPTSLRRYGLQGATVLGQRASGEDEDVGIKSLPFGAAAEAQVTKASSSWKPLASSTELSPG